MRFLVVTSVLLLAACGAAVPSYNWQNEPDPRKKEVELGVGDVLAISVWDNKDFNADVTIRADGTITMPLVGDIKAAGTTTSAIRKEIFKKVEQFVKFPAGQNPVTVVLKSWRSYRWTITGEFTRQGVFTSDHFVTLSEAISMAGGISRFAKGEQLTVFRVDPENGQTKKIPFNYQMLVSRKVPEMDIYILANDVIHVP